MHSPTSTFGWRRRGLLAGLLAGSAAVLAPAAASADVRCRYDPDSSTVRVTVLGDNADGSVSTLDPSCVPAGARKVVIKAGHGIGSDQLEIDAPERFHGALLDWRILGGTLFLIGDGRNSVHYTVGQDGVNFGAGDGVDLVFSERIGNLFLNANGAGGTLSGQGGAGTGAPTDEFLVLAAGRNKPEPQPFFTTEGLGATIIGGENSDEIVGASTGDFIWGRGGNDSITGANGDDEIDGGSGSDFLKGGRGNDIIRAADGEADHVDGGPGQDQAAVDAFDSLFSIETLL
jgi:hypothetical protein